MNIETSPFQLHPTSTLIVFDFDGTIIETELVILASINKARALVGFKKIDLESFRNRKRNTHLFVNALFRFVSPLVLFLARRKQSKLINKIKMEPGLLHVIRMLFTRGYRMGIISSNSEDNIHTYLRFHRMAHLFEFVVAGNGLYSKDALMQTVKSKKSQGLNMVYIGDEIRDVEAAKKVGIRVIGVTWGFDPKTLIAKSKPDWIVDTPTQLAQLFIHLPWWKKLLHQFL